MPTNLEIVSRVESVYKTYNRDDYLSRRFILKTLQDKATFLIAQKFRDRSLFREDNIYTTIPCFELEEIDTYTCDIIEYRSCNTVMKSVKKLPELIYSRYGPSIKSVINIDGSIEFTRSTPSSYRRNRRRQESAEEYTYYVKDGYLYIPDVNVEVVTLYLATVDAAGASRASCEGGKGCFNVWNENFVCPSKLLEVVMNDTLKEIGISTQIQSDEQPDGDSHIRSQKVT